MSRFFRFLLGRLFLLEGFLGADIFVLAVTPHTFALLGPFAPFGIATYAAYLCLGYSELKAQKEEVPFSMGFFLAHLACGLAISLINIAPIIDSASRPDP